MSGQPSQNSSYLREQAARCLRLARMCADATVAGRLRAIAEEFTEQAREIEETALTPLGSGRNDSRVSHG